jgi:hypothetical protein
MLHRGLAVCVAVLLAAPAFAADAKESIQLEVKGKVTTGINAIGGETTGVLIGTNKDFGCELAGKVDDKLNGKTVIVTGTFAVKDGVEVKQRRILTIDTIKETDEKPDEQYVKAKVVGTVKTGVAAPGGATTGTTITANGVTWELDAKDNKDLAGKLEKLDGKKAEVSGTVEVVKPKAAPPRPRTVVTVTEVKAVEEK